MAEATDMQQKLVKWRVKDEYAVDMDKEDTNKTVGHADLSSSSPDLESDIPDRICHLRAPQPFDYMMSNFESG